MKKIFKKSTAVFMAVLMLLSVVGVSAFAAQMYTISFNKGAYGELIDPENPPQAITVEKDQTIKLPGETYKRDGYTQTGWSRNSGGSGKAGDLEGSYKVDRNRTLYPLWTANTYNVSFLPGEGETGTTVSVQYDKTTNFPAAFTREDFVQTGWVKKGKTPEEDEVYGLTGKTPKILDDTVFYAVWEKCDYTVETSASSFDFGHVCVGYSTPASQQLVITNKGNMPLTYDWTVNYGYQITSTAGLTFTIDPGKSVTVNVQPMSGLPAGNYNTTLFFDCDKDVSDFLFDLSFTVNEHSFDKYYSDGNATYEQNGTKTAECSNGCGETDIVEDIGSIKVYSADNNTVEGLLKEYLYHKTVRATAYGSGTDNFAEDGSVAEGTKRFLPVSWYVNDEFNGEFKDDNFTINFVHTSFGKYTLTVKFVEQQYVDGEWVATGVEDEKSFDYYVGPSAEEEQEVIRPNMIVNIIFGLFSKLAELLSGFFA